MKNSLLLVTLSGVVALTSAFGSSSAIASHPSSKTGALSAFFGDALLPNIAIALCPPPNKAIGFGGMPIVFSQAIDTQGGFAGQPLGLNPALFRVRVKGSGTVVPTCATLQPAVDGTELRTVLLAGEFGFGGSNRPTRIDVVGHLRTVSGRSLKGLKIRNVDELNVGPRLVLAERFAVADGEISISREDDTNPNAYCPAGQTGVVVKLTFSGGITAPNGGSLQDDPVAMAAIQILGLTPAGQRFVLTPFALRDIDNDNHLDACLGAQALGIELKRAAVDGNVFFSPQNTSTPAGMVSIR